MAFDFPSSPINGQVFAPAGGPTYVYSSASGAWLASGGSSGGALGGAGYRNRLINGDFRIDQRNIGAAVDITAGPTYCMDRWYGYKVGAGTIRVTRTASGNLFYAAISVPVADASLAAGDVYLFNQNIEGLNVADLKWGTAQAKSIVISFDISANAAFTLAVAVVNSANNRSWVGTVAVTTTPSRVTLVVPGDITGTWLGDTGTGMQICFSLGAGSTFTGVAGWQAGNIVSMAGASNIMASTANGLNISDVQVEVGNVATPFEIRPYALEFLLAQRYYQEAGEGANSVTWGGYAAAGAAVYNAMTFAVQMRAIPTAVKLGSWGVTNCAQPSVSVGTPRSFVHWTTVTALGTALYTPNSADDKMTFSAEL